MATAANGHPVVFISHDVEDRKAAGEVSAALAAAGYAPWSLNDVYPGENVLLKAGRALERAEAIVVLLSPAAAESPVQRFVLEFAVNGDRFANRVVPVLLEPTADVPWVLEWLNPIRAKGRMRQACRTIIERLHQPVPA